MKTIVSVVIPTYNRCTLLRRAINSVIKQTYKKFEIVIVDNASIDGTKEYCKNLMKKYKNIRYIRNSENVGMIGNWNIGLANASGKYISLLMDDDYWHKDFLLQCAMLLNKNKKIGFVNVWVGIHENPDDDRYKLFPKNQQLQGKKCLELFLQNRWLVGLTSGVLFRKGVVDKFYPIGNELEFWLQFASKTDYYYIDKKLCFWTKDTAGSFSNNLKFDNYLDRRLFLIRKAYSLLKTLSNELENAHTLYKSALDYFNQEIFSFKKNNTSRLSFKYEVQFMKSKVRMYLKNLKIELPNNESLRDTWVKNQLKNIKVNSTILDAGAGECKYKKYCAHLKYTSQDLSQYDGKGDSIGLQQTNWNYAKINIISDIVSIPLPPRSFDVIICTEVFEHLPNPIKAILEFKRILKKDGILILTAPFCSLSHFTPHHYYSGFNKYFYTHHLTKNGFSILELKPSGNYFDYITQELIRLPEIATKYSRTGFNFINKIALRIMLIMLKKLSARDSHSNELLNFGYYVLAKKI